MVCLSAHDHPPVNCVRIPNLIVESAYHLIVTKEKFPGCEMKRCHINGQLSSMFCLTSWVAIVKNIRRAEFECNIGAFTSLSDDLSSCKPYHVIILESNEYLDVDTFTKLTMRRISRLKLGKVVAGNCLVRHSSVVIATYSFEPKQEVDREQQPTILLQFALSVDHQGRHSR